MLCLVTGATGFIGPYLIRWLDTEGYRVRAMWMMWCGGFARRRRRRHARAAMWLLERLDAPAASATRLRVIFDYHLRPRHLDPVARAFGRLWPRLAGVRYRRFTEWVPGKGP